MARRLSSSPPCCACGGWRCRSSWPSTPPCLPGHPVARRSRRAWSPAHACAQSRGERAPTPRWRAVPEALRGADRVVESARDADGVLGAAKGSTSLFRAVGPAELADIRATSALRNPGSAEGKCFTTSAAEASACAKQAVKALGDRPYTIIRTGVPNRICRGLSPARF